MSESAKKLNYSKVPIKKFGLVWEDKKEDIVENCKKNLPVLKEIKTKKIITDSSKPTNLLIEGDNYHALSILNYTHEGKIDVIYIDPPYNTGSKDWKYNNNYVDKEDSYKHSKWLSFMDKRLRLAKNLLTKKGIICVTIDDSEQSHLKLLLDEIFGEKNFLGTACIRSNPSGRTRKKSLSTQHEYGIFYSKNIDIKGIETVYTDPKERSHSFEKDNKGYFEKRNLIRNRKKSKKPERFFPIYLNPSNLNLSLKKSSSFNKEIYPISPNGIKNTWDKPKEKIMDLYKQKEIWAEKNGGQYKIFKKFRININSSKGGQAPYSLWTDPKYSARDHGVRQLKEVFNNDCPFDYPKSKYAVIDCLKAMSLKKDAIILDFFAGSGTTGHAVLEMNEEDGGNRQFILCTNNENKICEDITYERLKKIIKGYNFQGNKKDILFEIGINMKILKDIKLKEKGNLLDEIDKKKEKYKNDYKFENKFDGSIFKLVGVKKIKSKNKGLGGNLRYFKTDFISHEGKKPTDSIKAQIMKNATDILCIKENAFEEVKNNEHYKIFKNNRYFLGILFKSDKIYKFKEEIKKLSKEMKIYIFSLVGNDKFENTLGDLKNVKIVSVPEAILKVYRRIF